VAFLLSIAAIALVAFGVVLSGPVSTAQDSKQSVSAKSGPGDFYFYTGDRGEIQVPLQPSRELMSVRFAAGLAPEEARGLLLSTAGIAYSEDVALTERNTAYVPLTPGLTADDARTIGRALEADARVVYAQPVYFHGDERFGGTNRLIVKFVDTMTVRQIDALNAGFGVSIVKTLASGPNTFVLELPKESPIDALGLSNLYIEAYRSIVDYAHPDFVVDRAPTLTPNDTYYGNQWHLNSTGQFGSKVDADVDAPEAWDITQGSSTVVIAVIDTGMDLAHEDLTYVQGYDPVGNDSNPSPGSGENHATAVAGVAAAKGNNGLGVTGICQNCRVMPIRLIVSGAFLSDEADAFNYAWQNGASIINNSWGPAGSVATLPSSTKAAMDAATSNGRGGKGCVILFAAGNDNKNVDANGYAAYSKVIAVAASTNQDVKSSYSNFGSTLEVCAPSNGGSASIWTTDRTGGVGYSSSNYTSSFGGTSSACPLTAGVAGLMLTVNPNLTYTEVRTHLINTADKIDQAGGGYVNGYSQKYGYGKVNARAAVVAAGGTAPPPPPPPTGTVKTYNSTNVPLGIPDNNLTGIQSTLAVPDSGTINSLSCSVNITHTYIGDLNVSLVHPDGSTSVLHANSGGSADNLVQTYSVAAFNGKNLNGTWRLRVVDNAAQDVGTLNSWSLTIDYSPLTTNSYAFTSSGGLVPIPDNNAAGITSSIAVSGTAGTVTDVNIFVSITHTYKGDLTVTLIHPDGTQVILHNMTGGSADNVITTFDTQTIPAQPLTVLNGKNPTGVWQLKVTDTAALDTGTLNVWQVQLTTVSN
jgi:subtilisin-like proprotein convertase family protein